MTHHIKRLITEGEHQMLDFKFEISDSRKIARTLVAFANTDGGRLLVGVKDNGVIAGVRTEEEYYMAEGAAFLHCRPEVPIAMKEWELDGKVVVEILVEPSSKRPHFARDHEDKWKAYVRQDDQNFIANNVMLLVWKHKKSSSDILIRYREEESKLLQYLQEHTSISISKFQKIAGIPRRKAETILANFILLDLLSIRYEGGHARYYPNPQE
jgi:predicted HTH transcriptional regulator